MDELIEEMFSCFYEEDVADSCFDDLFNELWDAFDAGWETCDKLWWDWAEEV